MPAVTKVDISFSLPVPTILVRLAVRLVLVYRRLRYGHTFRRIKLTRGQYALVDVEDFERLNEYSWYCTSYGYAMCRTVPEKLRKGKKRHAYMHRLLCPVPEEMVVDHINRNKLDNRKANLRPATKRQNAWNGTFKKRAGKTCYRGVLWDKALKKWRVRLDINGRRKSFGVYADEIEAAKAYDRVVKKYRGEFAVLNFPER
jgi:HNH endonuclease